ncbi:MAG: dipicolinate synthase subunit B [Candidatus Wallacebacter cryptica]|nr:dipicolinate synthase subunit B [Bacillota bacterium]
MQFKGLRIGFAMTGSHCTYEEIWPQIENLVSLGADIYPIASHAVAYTDTRFGRGKDIIKRFEQLTGKTAIIDIVDAEPIGPKNLFDVMVIAPCTGNTTAKLANAITDSPVLMAAKAHLRNLKPLLLAISTNDGLGMNAKNIGVLLNTKNIYFVPFGQDNPEKKPNSLVADMSLLVPAVENAVLHQQLQPILIERALRQVK